MYSDNDSMLSSHSGSSDASADATPMRAIATATTTESALHRSTNGDAPPVVVDSDEESDAADRESDHYDPGGYRGPTEPSFNVPLTCLERCAVFIDGALFDSAAGAADENEQVVECSLKVVEYPFCRPTAQQTQTMLHTPVISAAGMTKIRRTTTVQRWKQQVASHHGVACNERGVSAGFQEFQHTMRDYRAHMEKFRHQLKYRSDSSSSTGAKVNVLLTAEEMYKTMPDVFWEVAHAAVTAWRSEIKRNEMAFLTTAKRHGEVCRCLVWLQKNAEVSLPTYQVFTVEDILGEDWEALMATEADGCSCGYHSYLMMNHYGNRRHCCEGTVNAMTRVIDAAVQKMH